MSTQDLAREVARVLGQRAPDGTFKYSATIIGDAIAVVLLAMDLADPDPASKQLLLEFALRVGLAGGTPAEAAAERVGTYFAENPLPRDLFRELRALLGTIIAEGRDDHPAVLRFQRLLARTGDAFEPRKDPSEGEVRADPLARFSAAGMLEEKPRRTPNQRKKPL